MSASNPQLPLYIDLDGTLIKTDLLFESLFLLIKRNPLYLLLVPLWLLKGRANLKAQIARRVSIDSDLLPFNEEFLEFLRVQHGKGRRLILISASNEAAVSAVGESLGLFSESIGSDARTNLKAQAKLDRIQESSNNSDFAYAGNSGADIPIWQAATEAIRVNCSEKLGASVGGDSMQPVFDIPDSWQVKLWQSMRPHQWLKNGLLFIPLILAHQVNDLHLVQHAVVAFIAFSLVASSVYLLNDLLDLEADRRHRSKRERPLAAGTLPIQIGTAAAPLLLIFAFVLAHSLTVDFVAVLGGYWLLTVLYSFYLKRVFLLDLFTLSGLYTLRLIAGAAAVGVQASPWLLAFSMALFLGLATVKRVTELINANGSSTGTLPGRAYSGQDLKLLSVLGVIASFLAVAIFAMYINADEITLLYSSPLTLWPICGLLFLVLFRIWNFTIEGRLQEDPVLFAISDHPSQLATALMFVVLWLAI